MPAQQKRIMTPETAQPPETPADTPSGEGLASPYGSALFRSAVSGIWYRNPKAAGNVDTVKVGPKQRHLRLPDGAEVVTGNMKRGDMVANIHAPKWEPIDREDEGQPAEWYDVVIRPQNAEVSDHPKK